MWPRGLASEYTERKMGYDDVMKMYEEASKRFHGTIAYNGKPGWIESLHKVKVEKTQTSKEEAIAKGYDRQLSMYAKFLEDEYGLKVASINIIPIKADYAAPVNQESYKESRPGSNQLLKKNAKGEYEEFKSANFEVGKEFPLDRLSDAELTASFDKMTETEKESIIEALQDQSETPSTEITKTDEIINSKPEIEESPADEEEEEGGRRRGGRLGRRSTSKPVDTSAEATAETIAPDNPNSLKSRLKDLENACGGKKKS